MVDFSDIFEMLSGDEENDQNQRKKKDETDNSSSGTDLKSRITNKVTKNKYLLAASLVAGIVVAGGAAYLLINYLGQDGIKGIIDIIKPFIN